MEHQDKIIQAQQSVVTKETNKDGTFKYSIDDTVIVKASKRDYKIAHVYVNSAGRITMTNGKNIEKSLKHGYVKTVEIIEV